MNKQHRKLTQPEIDAHCFLMLQDAGYTHLNAAIAVLRPKLRKLLETQS